MATLPRTTLGPVGPEVPALGLGLAAVGRPAYITTGRDALGAPGERDVETLRARAHALLDAAYAAGVRHVDAARSYGLAEDFLATWLDAREHDDVVVTSKWGYAYVGGWRTDAETHEVKDHSLAQYTRQRAETDALLGSRLAVYQIHSATLESGVLADRAVLTALADQRDAGIAAGLSVSGPRQADAVRRALEIEVGGAPVFSCVQATWNVLERSTGDELRAACDAGWGVVVKEGVANGRLTVDGPDGAPGSPLARVADRHGTTADALALACALRQPFAPSVLSGAVTVEQLRSNLAAADVPDAGVAEALDAVAAEDPEDYWSARSARDWS